MSFRGGALVGAVAAILGAAPVQAAESRGLPAKVRAVLLKDARSVAASWKDGSPHDIQAVLTTERPARQLIEITTGSRQLTPRPAGGTARIYLIAMEGSFSEPVTGLRRACQLLFLVLRVSVSTEQTLPLPRWSHTYPDLAKLGRPVLLAAG